MIGWIALYRTITDHWVWNTSSRRLQRWIDLLFLASWKERNVGFGNIIVHLERGQIVTSVRQLMGRWRTNNSTVTTTLKLFEDNGMITCERGRNMTIISVVNYNKYQRFAALAQSLADEQELMTQTVAPRHVSASENFLLKESDERHIRVHKQIPIEQDNNIIINKEQNIVVDDAHAKKKLSEFLSQSKVEQGCMTYHITPEQYKMLAEEIVNGWLFENEKDWSFKHFSRTMRIKVQILKKKQNDNGTNGGNNQTGDNPGGGESNPLSRARVHRADTTH